ncbi:MAG: beta-lactam-binding protein with PASTA domain [Sphingobacteriales bacterium]|jgi:beta-lactam-binding protein with PASTA domain
MISIFNFLKSRRFFLHLGLLSILLALMVLIFMKAINMYTNHGEAIEVPDLSGMTTEMLDEYLPAKNLRYVVVDSVYSANKIKGGVLEQDPPVNSLVKKGRKIYVTLVAKQKPTIKFPNLIDRTKREAMGILQSYDIGLHNIMYRPDIGEDLVLAVKYKDQEVSPGDRIPRGDKVTIVLGTGLGNNKVQVPNLTGLTRDEVNFVTQSTYLSIGGVLYDETVQDTAIAFVYKQIPASGSDSLSVYLNAGSTIDLFFTQDTSKINSPKSAFIP